jgi:multiple sugar transport system permease protein
MSRSGADLPRVALIWTALAIAAVAMAGPILIVLLTSLKAGDEVTVSSWSLLPRAWRFRNYVDAFARGEWGRYYANSIHVTAVAVAGSLLLNSLAGYSFARLLFPFRSLIFMLLLAGIMIPPQSIIIPQFLILKGIPLAGGNDLLGRGGRGLLNTRWALIIPELSGSLGIFLCRQFYLGFPRSLDEAARMDGASSFTTFTRVFLPLSGPILATLTVLKTIHMWNNFFFPLIMITSRDMWTVQLALSNFRGENTTPWELLLAATFVSILPIIAVFLGAQKYYVRGIISEGIKA